MAVQNLKMGHAMLSWKTERRKNRKWGTGCYRGMKLWGNYDAQVTKLLFFKKINRMGISIS